MKKQPAAAAAWRRGGGEIMAAKHIISAAMAAITAAIAACWHAIALLARNGGSAKIKRIMAWHSLAAAATAWRGGSWQNRVAKIISASARKRRHQQ